MAQDVTTRVSIGPGGLEADQNCQPPVCSADGRFIAFATHASNLVANDTNDADDVFLLDRQSGGLTRITLGALGGELAQPSNTPRMSADASVIAFSSWDDPVPGGMPGAPDLFAWNRASGTTVLVSVGLGGAAPSGPTVYSSVSADGRFIAFESNASNLVANDTNNSTDVFVRDLQNSTTERVSLTSSGQQASTYSRDAAISGDGRFVAFSSNAGLVTQDTNSVIDVYVRDRTLGTLTWISKGVSAAQPNGNSQPSAISADGNWIGFTSAATNLVPNDTNARIDAFLYSRATSQLQRINLGVADTQANWDVSLNSLSADGRFAGLWTFASNAAPLDANGVADGFVYDRVSGVATLVSRSTDDAPGDGNSTDVDISDDGRVAVFLSRATNLVSDDTNDLVDIFVRERSGSTPTIYCTAQTNSNGCVPAMSASGTPSVTSLAEFNVQASHVLNGKAGFVFYGFAPCAIPFHGGLRCVVMPLYRTPTQDSGGFSTPPINCTGFYSFDFNALIRAGTDPHLIGGTFVYTQYWSRDPLSVSTTNLTDALVFSIGP